LTVVVLPLVTLTVAGSVPAVWGSPGGRLVSTTSTVAVPLTMLVALYTPLALVVTLRGTPTLSGVTTRTLGKASPGSGRPLLFRSLKIVPPMAPAARLVVVTSLLLALWLGSAPEVAVSVAVLVIPLVAVTGMVTVTVNSVLAPGPSVTLLVLTLV